MDAKIPKHRHFVMEAIIARGRIVMRINRYIAACLGTLVLASCAVIGNKGKPEACPEVVIVRDLSRQVVRDDETSGMLARIEIDQVRPRCKVDGNKIILTPNIQLAATRTNPATPPKFEATYFVAVVKQASPPSKKSLYPVKFEFAKHQRRTYELPTKKFEFALNEGEDIANYRIYIGLQLTDAQISENRQLYSRQPSK